MPSRSNEAHVPAQVRLSVVVVFAYVLRDELLSAHEHIAERDAADPSFVPSEIFVDLISKSFVLVFSTASAARPAAANVCFFFLDSSDFRNGRRIMFSWEISESFDPKSMMKNVFPPDRTRYKF